MKFLLEIELGNDAMQMGADVAEALRHVANKMDGHYIIAKEGCLTIRDLNGNRVGEYKVTKEDPRDEATLRTIDLMAGM